MKLTMFIDESGDIGPRGSNFLIVVGILSNNTELLYRIIKNCRRNKFNKELVNISEIKGSSSSEILIKHLIKEINKTNCKVYCITLDKNTIPWSRVDNKNKIYDFTAGYIAELLELNSEIDIRIDKSKAKKRDQNNFDEHFKSRLSKNNRYVKIYHSYSHSWSGIQFADIIAWSFFQKFEKDDSQFVDLLKLDIIHVEAKLPLNRILKK